MAALIDTRRPSINVESDHGVVDSVVSQNFPSGLELDESVILGWYYLFSSSESLWFNHMGRGIILRYSALPFPGTEVIDVLRCGSPFWWYRTLKIVAQLPDGRQESYFLKVCTLLAVQSVVR